MQFVTAYISLLLMTLLVTGCATQRSEVSAPVSAMTKEAKESKSTTDSSPSPSLASSSGPNNSPRLIPYTHRTPEVAEEPSLALKIASELRGKYVIAETSPVALLITSQNLERQQAISLFEEAIALSKLRGTLKAHNKIPSRVVENTTLKNGTATIPFLHTTPPSDAAEVISKALRIDGVRCVHAVFGDIR